MKYFGNQLILFTIECKIIGYIENIDSIIGLEYLYFLYLDLSNICIRVGFHKNIRGETIVRKRYRKISK